MFIDTITKSGIEKYLDNSENFNITVLDSVDSTNAMLKKIATESPEYTVIIADSQSHGRGRFTRKFHSPENCGIYMSILLKPTLKAENSVLLTAAAAVAVSLAAEKLSGRKTYIKWVNDVLIDNKKICGILTEGSIDASNGGFNWAVVGIGINAYEPENGFSRDIAEIAAPVFNTKAPENRNRLIAEVLNIFLDFYKNLKDKTFYNEYKSRMLTIGKPVTVIKGDEQKDAVCLDLDQNCRLLVEYKDGKKEYLSSGEISVKHISST